MTDREAHVIDLLVAEPGLTGREIRLRSAAQTKWWSPIRLRFSSVYSLLYDMEERGLIRGELDRRNRPIVPYTGHSMTLSVHRFWPTVFPKATARIQ